MLWKTGLRLLLLQCCRRVPWQLQHQQENIQEEERLQGGGHRRGRPERVCTVLFLAQKSNQNTWFSAALDFSLVFRWFSAFSPTLCTVISKKTKLSCFGGFLSKQLLGFLGVVYMMKQGPNRNILLKILSKLNIAKKPFKHVSEI